jgi:antitoxin (DNA-binding transcriptional repressor) of toxin-antitoxin stability system
MNAMALVDAGSQISSIVGRMQPGESVTFMDGDRPVATLSKSPDPAIVRRAGCYKQAVFEMSADFDDPLEEFEAYEK